jgi:hypothetical protein
MGSYRHSVKQLEKMTSVTNSSKSGLAAILTAVRLTGPKVLMSPYSA